MNMFSARTRLAVVLSAILLSAFIATSLLNYRVSRQSVREELLTSALPLTRDTIFSEINRHLLEPIFVSSLMANDTFLKDWALGGESDETQITKYLTEIKNKYGYFTTFFVSSRSNSYHHFSGVLKTLTRQDDHDIWYYDFTASKKEYVLDVDTNQAAQDTLTIFINHRVEDYDGRLLGVAGVGLKMDLVAGLIKSFQEKYRRRIFLIDSHGLIQAHTDRTLVDRANITDMPGISSVAKGILDKNLPPTGLEYEGQNGNVLLSTRYIPELDWYLIVEQDEQSALNAARRNLISTLLIGLLSSAVIIAASLATVNHFQRRLEQMASTDELTGAANRRELETQFARAASRHERFNAPFSAIILDLDGFKQINDTLGHLAGDHMLKEVSNICRAALRPSDVLSRWGGDEFLILADGDAEQACALAERIRRSVAEAGLAKREGAGPLTVSMGVAQREKKENLDCLTNRADQSLMRSKAAGKDRVFAADGSES